MHRVTHGKPCVTRHAKENACVTQGKLCVTRHEKEKSCVTHSKPCVHMHVNGEVYKRGGKLVHRGGEQQK